MSMGCFSPPLGILSTSFVEGLGNCSFSGRGLAWLHETPGSNFSTTPKQTGSLFWGFPLKQLLIVTVRNRRDPRHSRAEEKPCQWVGSVHLLFPSVTVEWFMTELGVGSVLDESPHHKFQSLHCNMALR